jgi:hypothetical protein
MINVILACIFALAVGTMLLAAIGIPEMDDEGNPTTHDTLHHKE